MIKKVLLAAALSLLSSGAFAACTNPLSIKDGSGSTISMSMTSNADGFCQYNFNTAQINGVVPLMGNGATGTGSQRVTLSSDNSALPAAGQGATGAAPPAGATQMGVVSGSTAGGLLTAPIACDSSVVYDASTNGSTELVALSGTKVIYVCGYSIIAGGTVNVKLITGTGTACATGSSNKTPAYQLTAQAGISDGAPVFRGLKTAAGGALCINASLGVAVQAIVYYAQF